MIVYRIGSPAHPLLDGAGAFASDDARWNSRGRYVIYAAEHYATALLEKAAQSSALRLPRTLVYIRIELPADSPVEELAPESLGGWDADDKAASQAFGDRWYDEQRSLALVVPSLAAPGLERNVLINQRHSAFTRVKATRAASLVCHRRLLDLIRGTSSPGPPYTLARGDPDAPLRSRGSLAAARSRRL